jgi:hypothetical protein
LSDVVGRKTVYGIFFLLGLALYASVPAVGRAGHVGLFCGLLCLILTMYGGGFAAIPAYLADCFGTGFVGAIHGRLLTAWSVAGILGPVLVNTVNERQIRSGVPRAAAYDQTMVLLAGLLAVGFVCNLLVSPVARDGRAGDAPAEPMVAEPSGTAESADGRPPPQGAGLVPLAAFWLFATAPLLWGLWTTIRQAAVLFG